MKEKLSQRLEQLRTELKAGQQMGAELQGKLDSLRATMLRISGAIQVLEEMLGNDAEASETSHTATPEATARDSA
jgi:prefoldin subunit 5